MCITIMVLLCCHAVNWLILLVLYCCAFIVLSIGTGGSVVGLAAVKKKSCELFLCINAVYKMSEERLWGHLMFIE